MDNSRVRWAIVSLLILILLILSIWGVFSIAKRLFSSGSSQNSSQVVEPQDKLDDYNRPGVIISFELQGPVVAETEHTSYKIIVGRSERIMQVMRGYSGTVEREQRYTNDEASYAVFLKSIAAAGFDAKNNSTQNDERGACPLGRRYIYTINDNGMDALRTWNTSCGQELGTSEAGTVIRTLFQKQIPDFNTLTQNTTLR
ncbi:MAG: hypothetical protein M3Q70_01020 [bacterium]|nr:hypothetical protein [bacterium]